MQGGQPVTSCRKTLGRLATGTILTTLFVVALAPLAAAQVGGITDTASGVTDTVGSGAGGATGTVKDTVDKTVDTVNDTVDKTGGTVDQTVGDTTDKVNDTTGPVVEDPVKKVTETAKGVVDKASNDPTVETVRDTVDQTLGTVGGSGQRGGEPTSVRDPQRERGTRGNGGDAQLTPSSTADRAGSSPPETAPSASGTKTVAVETTPTSELSDPSSPGLVENIIRSVTAAAKKMAFPLMLVAMVGGFLLVQGRFDRKDPKLALARVDSQDDFLSFE